MATQHNWKESGHPQCFSCIHIFSIHSSLSPFKLTASLWELGRLGGFASSLWFSQFEVKRGKFPITEMSLCINTLSGLCECRIRCRILNIGSALVWAAEEELAGVGTRKKLGSSLQLFYAVSTCWQNCFLISFFFPNQPHWFHASTCLPSELLIFPKMSIVSKFPAAPRIFFCFFCKLSSFILPLVYSKVNFNWNTTWLKVKANDSERDWPTVQAIQLHVCSACLLNLYCMLK